MVQSGAYDVGALSEKVWGRAVENGTADPALVKEFYTTPPYFNYNWTVQGNLDEIYGEGFTDKLREALLGLNLQEHGDILMLFSTEKFIETENENYAAIEEVARELGLVEINPPGVGLEDLLQNSHGPATNLPVKLLPWQWWTR